MCDPIQISAIVDQIGVRGLPDLMFVRPIAPTSFPERRIAGAHPDPGVFAQGGDIPLDRLVQKNVNPVRTDIEMVGGKAQNVLTRGADRGYDPPRSRFRIGRCIRQFIISLVAVRFSAG